MESPSSEVLHGEGGGAQLGTELCGLVKGASLRAGNVTGDEGGLLGEFETGAVLTECVHAEVEGLGFGLGWGSDCWKG